MALSGPAGAGGEGAGKGLGAREGPCIPRLGSPAPAPRLLSSSGLAAPPRRDPRPPREPDAVSATSSSASGKTGPAPRPNATLAPAPAVRSALREAAGRHRGAERVGQAAPPGAARGTRTLARPRRWCPGPPARAALELFKVLHPALVARR